MTRLTGTDLISRVDSLRAEGKTATQVVVACGYVKENGKGQYTEFYTALIEAKGLNLPDDEPVVSEENQSLYDRLTDAYHVDAVNAFIELNGEDYLESFEDAYRGAYDSEADFAEEFTTDIHGEIPSYVVVDWQGTWDANLRYDFDFQDGYVFDRNF